MTSGRVLFDQFLDSIHWSEYNTSIGNAAAVKHSLRQLVDSKSAESANNCYWEIENIVFVQGAVFNSAVPVVTVCFLALSVLDIPSYVECMLLEIIFFIATGVPATSDEKHDGPSVDAVCLSECQKGLWLLYNMISGPHMSAALEIIEVCETDPTRLRMVRSLRESDPNATVVK